MELMEFEHKRLENLRSKIKDPSLIEGERLSIVEVSKQLHHKDPISKSNPEANGDRKINLTMSEVHQHFSTVFSQDSENVTDQNHDPLSSIQKQLNIDEANTLIRHISQEEILGTLKQCSKKKSPGPDGLTYEFYLEHFEVLKANLKKLFNSYPSGQTNPPTDFAKGIIPLIPKKKDEEEILKIAVL